MAEMRIIDCHEHLQPEAEALERRTNDLFVLFGHYCRYDLFSAGMDSEQWRGESVFAVNRPVYNSLFDEQKALQERWAVFKPYYEQIKYGSYARAARLAAKLIYGVEDINDNTCEYLSEQIAKQNRPGIYKRILAVGNIEASITQCERAELDYPLVPVMPGMYFVEIRYPEKFQWLCEQAGEDKPVSLEEYLNFIGRILDKWIEQGAVGIKLRSIYNREKQEGKAKELYAQLLKGREITADERGFEELQNYILHEVIDLAAERGLTICVHAGIWGDFRNIDSKNMLTLAAQHPQAKFDLYHLGMPFVRDTIVIAKNYPNVYLNLCWCHIISQAQTCSALDELLDQVPVNKISAFGGDYIDCVEKVIGHLYMARENFAKVFGGRIDRGLMDFDDAMEILHKWFWENPLCLYKKLKPQIKDM